MRGQWIFLLPSSLLWCLTVQTHLKTGMQAVGDTVHTRPARPELLSRMIYVRVNHRDAQGSPGEGKDRLMDGEMINIATHA